MLGNRRHVGGESRERKQGSKTKGLRANVVEARQRKKTTAKERARDRARRGKEVRRHMTRRVAERKKRTHKSNLGERNEDIVENENENEREKKNNTRRDSSSSVTNPPSSQFP